MHSVPESENNGCSDLGELEILDMYRQISEEDKEEIYMMLSLKVKRIKIKKEQGLKSTISPIENKPKMA